MQYLRRVMDMAPNIEQPIYDANLISDHIYSFNQFSFIVLHIMSLIDLCALVSRAHISRASARLDVFGSTPVFEGYAVAS
uniref:Transmembrane protein n=1 Tax=Ascaris lumbricoides TaxID=6252 RepID=A0A0M3IRU7_ASCLU